MERQPMLRLAHAFRPRRPALVLLVLLLLPWSAALTASAAVTTGTTAGLVNPEQPLREASSAVPVVGFAMTADTTEALDFLTVTFQGAGFDAGDDRDLRALDTDSAVSGVGLYRDAGAVDDALDAGDTPVQLDGINWNGNDVEMDLTGNAEHLPATVTGSYEWLLVVRSADNSGWLREGDRIAVRMRAASIVATDGLAFAVQPALDLVTNAFIVRLTRTVSMLGGFPWIGPSTATLHERAVLGLRAVDGGVATNYGVNDTITSLSLQLAERAGSISTNDFAAISTDPTTSGLALYRDNGTTDDAWDPSDAPIAPATLGPAFIFPGTTTTFTFTFSPPILVPKSSTGALDFFFVVRTNSIVSSDAFELTVPAGGVTARGLLAGATSPTDDALPLLFDYATTRVPSGNVRGDSTPPLVRNPAWADSSPYLASIGSTIYFNRGMPSVEMGSLRGGARDDESGLARISYSSEPTLASSPANQTLLGAGFWVAFSGDYGFNASSADVASPANVTLFDRVGNALLSSDAGVEWTYIHEEQPLTIQGNPGWTNPSQNELFVDANGILWFGPQIASSATADLTVRVLSLYGGGVLRVSASSISSIGGPSPASTTYAPGVFSVTWTSRYTFFPNSTAPGGFSTVTASDQAGGSVSATFPLRKDNVPPAVTILAPGQGTTVSGGFIIRVDAADAGSGLASVEAEIDPAGPWVRMYFDGTAYFLTVSSAAYPDGAHRVIARARDHVGNEAVASVDIVLQNSAFETAPPAVSIASPGASQIVAGMVLVTVGATDASAIAGVTVSVAGGSPQPAALNATSGLFELVVDTRTLPEGDLTLVAAARDAWGNAASSAPVTIRVDNAVPSAAFGGPASGSILSGLTTFTVSATDAIGVASVTLNLDGVLYPLAFDAAAGMFVLSLDTGQLADGTHSARATAVDLSGKSTESAALSFRVKNTHPMIAFVSPAASAFVAGELVLAFNATDSVGVAGVSVSVGALDPAQASFDSASRTWRLTVNSAGLPDGPIIVAAVATGTWGDASGEARRSFTVDNSPPSVRLDWPAAGDRVAGVVVFRVASSDAIGLSGVVLEVGGRKAPMQFNPSTGYFEFTLDTRSVADGPLAVRASATDLSGKNAATESVALTVQNGDLWRDLRAASPFLLLLTAIAAIFLVLWLGRRGTLARWAAGDSGTDREYDRPGRDSGSRKEETKSPAGGSEVPSRKR